MDQDIFRKTYREMNERACVFEKSNLSGACRCTQAERFYLAEREGVHCKSEQAQEKCIDFMGLLRQQSRFALKSNDVSEVLPHGKAMRIQVGGMRGVYLAVHDEEEAPVQIEDVHSLLQRAIGKFGDLSKLPYQQIMIQVAAYKGRTRGKRNR
ncbi:MAG: hypothetical protein ABW162_07375 [Candidatus Sedimenticola sp. PURPLELP]